MSPSSSRERPDSFKKKSRYYTPERIKPGLAVLFCIGWVLDHEIHRCLRQVFHQLGDPCHGLMPCSTARWRDLVRNAELRQRAPFLRIGNRPAHPIRPDMKYLLTK